MGGIVVRNRCQGPEQYFAVGAGVFALDEQDEAVKLVLDIFGLGEMKRFARSANDGDRPRPVTSQKRKLAHGLALPVDTVRNGLLCGKRETERNQECSCEERCGKKGRKSED